MSYRSKKNKGGTSTFKVGDQPTHQPSLSSKDTEPKSQEHSKKPDYEKHLADRKAISMEEIINDKNAQDKEHKRHVMKYQERGFGERLGYRIDELEGKHEHKLPIGVKPLSTNEKLELNGRLNKEFSFPASQDFTPRTIELMNRITSDERNEIAGLASDGFTLPTRKPNQETRFNYRKDDDYKEMVNEEREHNIAYNKKYDKWGMIKN